jgi:small subunit ribosomal protein S16
VAVRIRLMRMGKIRNPQYRIVVADARTKRDGKAIERLGIYHPKEDPSRMEVNEERALYWLSVGAQPSDPVKVILRKTGVWQKFKGLPPPTKALQVAPPRADRHAVYEAEAKAAAGLADQPGKGEAAPAKKTAKKAAAKKAEAAAPGEPEAAAQKPAAEKAAKATKKTAAKKAAPSAAETAEEPGTDAGGQG